MVDANAGLEGIRRALVVGLGVSGRAAARLLAQVGLEVGVVEDAPGEVEQVPGTTFLAESSADLDVTAWDVVVPSPGVPEHAPVIQHALAASMPIWSEPEAAWRVRPHPILGITGTNGKTTVTGLVADMLEAAGLPAVACGNIGRPMAAVVGEHLDDSSPLVLVAELSSFQLRFADTLAVEVGVILNVAPDHVDWHGTWEAYRDAKARLFRTAGPGTVAVAGDDDEARAIVAASSAGTRWQTSASTAVEAGVGVVDGWLVATDPAGPLLALADLPLPAPHVVANAAAAAAAALAFGVEPTAVTSALEQWEIGAHRLQVIAESDGVRWIDDSKATNVHAAVAALASADSIVWIAGGQAKGTDLSVLGEHVGNVRHAVLLGESADVLAEVCAASNVPVSRAGTMQQAVLAAAAEARPGDTVLLSPAGASFDLFDGYADRGDQFAAAVRDVADRSTP